MAMPDHIKQILRENDSLRRGKAQRRSRVRQMESQALREVPPRVFLFRKRAGKKWLVVTTVPMLVK
jgi:hypothetical protein